MFCSFPTERLSLNNLNTSSISLYLYPISVYICNEAASFHQSSEKLQEMIGKKLLRGRKWRGDTKNTTWFIFVLEVISLLQTKGLRNECKKTLLARVAERVLVKGGKSNLMAEVKTWFLIVLSASICKY